jgi:hypothetical protein
MTNIRKLGKVVSAEQISRLAERGEDVSCFFTNSGSITGPLKALDQRYLASSARKSKKGLMLGKKPLVTPASALNLY